METRIQRAASPSPTRKTITGLTAIKDRVYCHNAACPYPRSLTKQGADLLLIDYGGGEVDLFLRPEVKVGDSKDEANCFRASLLALLMMLAGFCKISVLEAR